MTNENPAARQLLRRIAICFVVIVLTLPLVMMGGAWNWVLLADIAVAAVALWMALKLRSLTRSE